MTEAEQLRRDVASLTLRLQRCRRARAELEGVTDMLDREFKAAAADASQLEDENKRLRDELAERSSQPTART